MATQNLKVLLIGGYGFFGRRLTTLLLRNPHVSLVLAGRRVPPAPDNDGALPRVSSMRLDVSSESFASELACIGADVVVHLAGPFQAQDYRVAQACIAAKCHYLDLADGRDFVDGISQLDAKAKDAGVMVLSGVSTLPALSGAAIDQLGRTFSDVSSIDMGISPGNKTDRGRATVAAVLGYCGEPIQVWRHGGWTHEFGWCAQAAHDYPAPVGRRWLSLCDVPDLVIQPARHRSVRSVTFRAGQELPVLHFGLAALSWLRRWRLLPNLSRFAPALHWASELLLPFGSDAGAMHVELAGTDQDGQAGRRRWTIVAERNDGPFIPTLAAAIVRKLTEGQLDIRGAKPCCGVLQLEDFRREWAGLAVRDHEEAL
ncbi:hypothetical protein F6X40_23725 [Paraburkholderia sp. UCT31]|uniref:saccharopine dehydrogenase family protein n=1 Tax=Paraburkholderia sp. UCT31 TaxID=2615209 RepID=UPI001655C1E5|nr:saccharopine dehydrogenase NADP-binding domain-containing protein [Paraburkholderia sp. UCT31]MBC8739726.1 hypothetical protein [Paraburkholderia sp. UCT31]